MSEFIESLPEEIRESEHLTDIEDAGTLATKYIERMSAINPDLVSQLPDDLKKNETFKDMDVGKLATSYLDIRDKLPTLPVDASEYSFEFPEDLSFNEADHKLFKDYAFEIGLTQAQFEKLNAFDVNRIGRIMESYEAERQEAWKTVGKDTGLTETEISESVDKVSKALGLEKLIERVDLKSDPEFIKAMLNIKDKISEDVLKLSASGGKQRPTGPDGQPRLVFNNTPGMDGS